jgi:hypothetical protein
MDGTLVGGKHISHPASIDHLRQCNYVLIMPWVTSGAHEGDDELSFFLMRRAKRWHIIGSSSIPL